MAVIPSVPSGYIPNVWDGSGDAYSHAQLEQNWNAIDLQITRLDKERIPLGTIISWWRPSATISVPSNWVVCDGRLIGTNGMGVDGTSVRTPDLRNRMLVGSLSPDGSPTSPTPVAYSSDGHAASLHNSQRPNDAPGINGQQGSMARSVIPPHFHNHVHLHQVAGLTPYETGQVPDGQGMQANLNPSGTVNVAKANHQHNIFALYSSDARNPANPNMRVVDAPNIDYSQNARPMTTKQIRADSSHASLSDGSTLDTEPQILAAQNDYTTETIGAPTNWANYDDLWIDARPASTGVLFLMKVLHDS